MKDLVDAVAAGQRWLCFFQKVTGAVAYTAGRYYDVSMLAGSYGGNPYIGNMLDATQLWYKSVGNLFHGALVTPKTKYLLQAGVYSTSTTSSPAVFLLCDYLMHYPFVNFDSTDEQVFTTDIALPRYPDGDGVRAFMVTTTDLGGATAGITFEYTNSDGDAKTVPYALQARPSAIPTEVPHAGTLAGQYGPFVPLADGDSGMQKADSITLDAGMGAGYGALVLCKPIVALPFHYYLTPAERHMLADNPKLPVVHDQAYLGMLYYAGAATAVSSMLAGYVDLLWS